MMDKRLSRLFMLLSVFAISVFAGCKNDDDERDDANGGETPKEEDIIPSNKSDAEGVMKKLCAKVWGTENSYYTYELVSEDDNVYYLKMYANYIIGNESDYYIDDCALSKKPPYMLIDLDQRQGDDYRGEKYGWDNSETECDLSSASYKRRDDTDIITEIKDYEFTVEVCDEFAGDCFATLQKDVREAMGETIECPSSPKLMNLLCKTGWRLYWGDKDSEFYYLGEYEYDYENNGYTTEHDYDWAIDLKCEKCYQMSDEPIEGDHYKFYKKVKLKGKEYWLYEWNYDNVVTNKIEVVSDFQGEYVRMTFDRGKVKAIYNVDREELIRKCKEGR